MSGYLIGGLFGAAFITAIWTLVVSVRPQIHRFRELAGALGRGGDR